MLTQLKSSILKMRQVLTEYRSGPRLPCSAELRISWSDARGRVVHDVARCLDISDTGARIECHEAVAKLTPIQISSQQGCVLKTGKVCYCEPEGSGFQIGIEFY